MSLPVSLLPVGGQRHPAPEPGLRRASLLLSRESRSARSGSESQREILRRRCRRRTWRSCGPIEAFRPRRRRGASIGLVDPDVECDVRSSDARGRRHRGIDGCRSDHGTLTSTACDELRMRVEEFDRRWRRSGASSLALRRSRSRRSGVEVRHERGLPTRCTVRDGKVVAVVELPGLSTKPSTPQGLGVGDVAGERGDREDRPLDAMAQPGSGREYRRVLGGRTSKWRAVEGALDGSRSASTGKDAKCRSLTSRTELDNVRRADGCEPEG